MPAHVSLITRLPLPGATKTRLVPVLGEAGAAAVASQMAAHVALQLRLVAATGDASVDARVDGGSLAEALRWLKMPALHQGEGDLGKRLERALRAGLARAQVAAVIGGDCPTLDATDIRKALGAARDQGVAIVPARDGGFCLMAVSRTAADALGALSDVEWGTEAVCAQVLEHLAAIGMSAAVLAERSDVDVADDLPAWEAVRQAWAASPRTLAVVLPVLDEAATLPAVLERVCAEADEVIVADGGSSDGSRDIARAAGARVIPAPRGRASQMNAGAAVAASDAVLFLHADSMPEPGFRDAALEQLARPDTALGAFRFSLTTPHPAARIIEYGANWRARHLGLPYGDQGLFLRTAVFRALGGFPDVPALEDLLLVEAARRVGRIAIAPGAVDTSDRRWRETGWVRWTALNLATLAGHRLGVSTAALAAWRARSRQRYSKR